MPPILNEDVQDHALLVHRSPEIMQHAIDAQKPLVEVPSVARLRPAPPRLAGELRTELSAPAPDALMGDGDAPLCQDQFHIPQAQAKYVIQPDCVADDLRRKGYPG